MGEGRIRFSTFYSTRRDKAREDAWEFANKIHKEGKRIISVSENHSSSHPVPQLNATVWYIDTDNEDHS
jgi:hypothetical protein